jgi:cytosine/uracil/thiamine/allantoin permease
MLLSMSFQQIIKIVIEYNIFSCYSVYILYSSNILFGKPYHETNIQKQIDNGHYQGK